MAMALRHLCPLKAGRRRHFLLGTHIGPDDPALLDRGIGLNMDFLGEAALRGFIHLVYAGASHIELPAMVHAAQAGFLVAPEPQGNPTVWAELL